MTPDYATNAPQGYMGDWKRGAPMGRPAIAPDPRTEQELLDDFAAFAVYQSQALQHKENRNTPDAFKPQYWQEAADYFKAERVKIKALLADLKARVQETPKISLQRVHLDSGGYDPQGAYFGHGEPIFWAADESGAYDVTFRAKDRDAAKAHVRESYPGARFYR